MKEPIKPEDIREGDLIRWESEDEPDRANEYRAKGPVIKVPGRHYLLDRPTPAVDLPTKDTLGWLSIGDVEGSARRYRVGRSDRDGTLRVFRDSVELVARPEGVTAFVEAVAVPKAALNELRNIGFFATSETVRAKIKALFAAIDAANGDPR